MGDRHLGDCRWKPGFISWTLALISLIYALIGLLVVVEVAAAAADSLGDGYDPHLRLTVQESALRRVASCVTSYSEIELKNMHPHESVVVRGMHVVASSDTDGDSNVDWMYAEPSASQLGVDPPQVHVPRFANKSLTLHPGQSVTVPIAFFPFFRSEFGENPRSGVLAQDHTNKRSEPQNPFSGVTDDREKLRDIYAISRKWLQAQSLSKAAAADLAELVEEVQSTKGSTHAIEHVVRARIVAETSHGLTSAPVTLSSLRKNAYGIPDSIIFSGSATVRAGHEYGSGSLALRDRQRRKYTGTSGSEAFAACQYDIFLDNPSSTKELKLLEIFSSAPELFQIETMTKSSADNLDLCRHSNCYQRRGDNSLCNLPKEWSSFSPVVVPPSNRRVYVGTVRLTDDLRDGRNDQFLGMNEEVYLGYVHIRTNINVLSVSVRLRWSRKERLDVKFSERDVLQTGKSAPKRNATGPDASPENSKVGPTPQSSDIEQEIVREITAQTAVLSASPEKAEFGLLTKPTQQSRITINVTNHGTVALGLMRVTVSLDTAINPKAESAAESNGGKTDDDISDGKGAGLAFDVSLKEDEGKKIVVEPGATALDAVVLNCYAPVELDHPLGGNGDGFPLRYSGAIVIRAGEEKAVSYEEWAEDVVNDPTSSHHLLLEVPFSASVMHGRIAFDSSSLVFPVDGRQLNLPPRSAHPSAPSASLNSESAYMDRSVVFVNRFPVPLRLLDMHIRGSDNTSSGSDSFCSSRFLVLDNSNGMTAKIEESSRLAKSGQRWEHISIRYLLPPASELKNGTNEPGVLTNCTLSLKTDKAGEFSVPVKVYSGKLNAFMDSETLPSACSGENGRVPFPSFCPSSWLNQTTEGAALRMSIKRRLETREESERKKEQRYSPFSALATENDSGLDLLRRFVSLGLEPSVGSGLVPEDIFSPLIVNLGAVRPDKVKTRFVHLMNKNPVAVDIKEVTSDFEGISIRVNDVMGKDAKIPSRRKSNRNDANDVTISCLDEKNSLKSECDPKTSHRNGESSDETTTIDLDPLEPPAVSSLVSSSGICARQPCSGTNKTNKFSSVEDYVRRDAKMKGLNYLSFLASSDGFVDHDLHLVSPSAEKQWSIPPGSTVQIEVGIRAPPVEALNAREVTSFVGSGIVLETNQGEVIPIVVCYDVTFGEITLQTSGQQQVSSFGIELVPFVGADSGGGRTDEKTLAFEVKSSFQTALTIHNISSCSEWFSAWVAALPILIDGEDVAGYRHEERDVSGVMMSRLRCGPSNTSEFSSFFDCAIRWLEERDVVQPPGCGLSEDEIWALKVARGDAMPKDGVRKARDDVRSRALEALRTAQNYVNMHYDPKTHAMNVDPSSFLSRGFNGGEFPIDLEAIKSIVSELKEGAHVTNANVVLNKIFPTQNGRQRQIGRLDGGKVIEDISGEFVREGMVTFSHSRQSGLISLDVQDIFAKVADVWRELSELGMDVVTSSLRAHATFGGDGVTSSSSGKCEAIDCPDNQTGTIHLLPVSSPPLRTTVQMPCLACGASEDSCDGKCVDGSLSFGAVEVGQAQELYVWIQNPSETPVRARLAFGEEDGERLDSFFWSHPQLVDRPQKLFLQTKRVDSHPWWTGGSYYISDFAGQSIQSSRHVIVSRNGDNFARATPSVASTSALLVGCTGRRCGLRPEDRKVGGEEPRERATSPLGASAANGAVLNGKDYEADAEEYSMDESSSAALLSLFPVFGAGMNVIDEVVLDPFEKVELGPVYFRPTSPGRFDWDVYIENSLTGLERVALTGRGVRGNLVFVDESSPWDASDIENRFGRPTLLFRKFSQSGGERNVKSVGVVNTGDADVSVEDMYISVAGVRLPASRAGKRNGRVSEQEKSCSARGFRLLECTDSWGKDVMFSSLLARMVATFGLTGPTAANETPSQHNSPEIDDNATFILRQNERRTIHIDYVSDCSFSSLYTALVVEYRRSDGSGELFESILYLGFDHASDNAVSCDPSAAARDLLSSLASKFTAVTPGSAKNRAGIGLKSRHNLSYSVVVVLIVTTAVVILFVLRTTTLRLQLNDDFERMLVRKGSSRISALGDARGKERDVPGTVANVERLSRGYGLNWLSTYRGLANFRCGQSELVMFGDNIIRDVVKKHKLNGAQRPQCFEPSGGFTERPVKAGAASFAKLHDGELSVESRRGVSRSAMAAQALLRPQSNHVLPPLSFVPKDAADESGPVFDGSVTSHAFRVEKLLGSRMKSGDPVLGERVHRRMPQVASGSLDDNCFTVESMSAASVVDGATDVTKQTGSVLVVQEDLPAQVIPEDGVVCNEGDLSPRLNGERSLLEQTSLDKSIPQSKPTTAAVSKGRGSDKVVRTGDRGRFKKGKVHPTSPVIAQDPPSIHADRQISTGVSAPRSQGGVVANGDRKSKHGRRGKHAVSDSVVPSKDKVTLTPQSSQRSMATTSSSQSSTATSADATLVVSSPTEFSHGATTTSPCFDVDKRASSVLVATPRLAEQEREPPSPQTVREVAASVTATVVPDANPSSARTVTCPVDSGIRPPPGLPPPPGFEMPNDSDAHLSPRENFPMDEPVCNSPDDKGRASLLVSPRAEQQSPPHHSFFGNTASSIQGSDLLAGSIHREGLDSISPLGLGGPVVAPLSIGNRKASSDGVVSPFLGEAVSGHFADGSSGGTNLPCAADMLGRGSSINVMNILGGLVPDPVGQSSGSAGEETRPPAAVISTSDPWQQTYNPFPPPSMPLGITPIATPSASASVGLGTPPVSGALSLHRPVVESEEDMRLLGGIPLLTPASLLLADRLDAAAPVPLSATTPSQVNPNEADDDRKDDEFGKDSFYARLLGD